MRSTIISALFLIISLAFSAKCLGQTKFASGYIIDNDGKKISCLILDKEWKNSPVKITYKLQENDEPLTASASDVKGFGIDGVTKYVTCLVKVDRSAFNKNSFGTNSEPDWEEHFLFLKVLQEGQANLYAYELTAAVLFFYNVKDSPIEQLVFKEYLIGGGKLRTNALYLNQLNASMNCGNSYARLAKMKYASDELEQYFKQYNRCIGGGQEKEAVKAEVKKRAAFNIKPTIGLTKASLELSNKPLGIYTDYGSSISPRFGLELDYTLPFNNRKWEIYLEPVFHQYDSKASGVGTTSEATRFAGEAHLGLRHYFFLSKNSKLLLTLEAVNKFMEKGGVTSSNGNFSELDFNTKFHFAIGGGYEFKKLSLAIRYSNKNVLSNYVYWVSDFKALEVYLGYKLFRQYAE